MVYAYLLPSVCAFLKHDELLFKRLKNFHTYGRAEVLRTMTIQNFDCSALANGFECFEQYSRQDSASFSHLFAWKNLPVLFGVPYTLVWFWKFRQALYRRQSESDPIFFDEKLEESFREAMTKGGNSEPKKSSAFQICPQCEGRKVFLGKCCDLCDGKGLVFMDDDQFYLPVKTSGNGQAVEPPSSSKEQLEDDDDSK